MKIGKVVQAHIPAIFRHFDRIDHAEFARLCDKGYSKETFDINFPFCKPVDEIGSFERRRYWAQIYLVRGVSVRVTSKWFDAPTSHSRVRLIRYLEQKDIEIHPCAYDAKTDPQKMSLPLDGSPKQPLETARQPRGRYRSSAIGIAQNALVRNILSNIGEDAFSPEQWQKVIDDFGARCAYCRSEGDLVMDHVVPINRTALGGHRIGNLVPACRDCNSRKGDKEYQEFLEGNPEAIKAIDAHMERYDYVPIGDNEQIREIVEIAHKELPAAADRYIRIINTLLNSTSSLSSEPTTSAESGTTVDTTFM